MKKLVKRLFLLTVVLLCYAPALFADNAFFSDLETLSLPENAGLTPLDLAGVREGEVQLVVRLKDAPLAVANGANSKSLGGRLTPDQQRAYLSQLEQKQDALMLQI